MKTIQSFSEPEDRNAFSRVMDFHQKSRGGNRIIVENLSDHYLMPYRFETFVYASQLFQADEIDRAVQHMRRIRGTCMGSIYWQLNDTAPVASWAGIDYYGRYKALHYASRRFYAPVALGMFVEDTTLTVNLANETRNEFCGKLSVRLCRNDLTVLEETECAVCAAELTSVDVFTQTYTPDDRYSTYLVATLYDENGEKVFQKTALFVPPKHFAYRKPAITVDFEKTDACTARATVRSNTFAGRVYLDFADFDCVLSDNFFDIAAAEPYELTFRTEKSAEELASGLTLLSVYDIGV
jgi:beta-mannosidase